MNGAYGEGEARRDRTGELRAQREEKGASTPNRVVETASDKGKEGIEFTSGIANPYLIGYST